MWVGNLVCVSESCSHSQEFSRYGNAPHRRAPGRARRRLILRAWHAVIRAPIAQLAEAADLKSAQCRFESDWGHRISAGRRTMSLARALSLRDRGPTPARKRFTPWIVGGAWQHLVKWLLRRQRRSARCSTSPPRRTTFLRNRRVGSCASETSLRHLRCDRSRSARRRWTIASRTGASRQPGSQSGNVAATDLLDRGLLHILSSDYVPSSPLQAVFQLAADGVLQLTDGARLVSGNPAPAVGLHDRGQIAVGKRADLVRIAAHTVSTTPSHLRGRQVPVVRAVYREGIRVS